MTERKEQPCTDFRAEPGAEVVAYSLCQECGWDAYQHLSWASDPDGRRMVLPESEDKRLIDIESPSQKHYHTKPGLIDTGSQNIVGYRPQTEASRDLVNEVKQLEADHGFWLERVYFAHAKANGVSLDPRQVASARTHFEYAFYHLNRAVFQPADPIGDAVTEGLRRG